MQTQTQQTLRTSSIELFSELVAGASAAPGGGAVAAAVVELAAGLVAKAARGSEGWPDAEGVVAQAQALRRRATPMLDQSVGVFSEAVAALRAGSGHDAELGDALALAADVPLAVLETAVAVTQLAAQVAEHGEQTHRPEAVGAGLLSEAAAATCAHLVRVNLLMLSGDKRVERADVLARQAAQARAELERSVAS